MSNSDDDHRFRVMRAGDMLEQFYQSDETPPQFVLDARNVPSELHLLIPLAEKWGISDDLLRRMTVQRASSDEIESLRRQVDQYSLQLDDWLAGPAALHPPYSVEYLAFTHLRMVADGC